MNNHCIVSFIKSGIRIASCYAGFYNIEYFLIGMAFAELLGIVEELADTRK